MKLRCTLKMYKNNFLRACVLEGKCIFAVLSRKTHFCSFIRKTLICSFDGKCSLRFCWITHFCSFCGKMHFCGFGWKMSFGGKIHFSDFVTKTSFFFFFAVLAGKWFFEILGEKIVSWFCQENAFCNFGRTYVLRFWWKMRFWSFGGKVSFYGIDKNIYFVILVENYFCGFAIFRE